MVELRRHGRRVTARAETLTLPAGGRATLLAPYLSPGPAVDRASSSSPSRCCRTCTATAPRSATRTTRRRARSSDYQTIFATEPGSAEMPSAGRPFTKRTLQALRDRGVSVQRITLHTGVSSQERGERPYPERYHVSAHTARRINERSRPA